MSFFNNPNEDGFPISKPICTDYLENDRKRRYTFMKRSKGLFKKVQELESMTNCNIMVIITTNEPPVDGRNINKKLMYMSPTFEKLDASGRLSSYLKGIKKYDINLPRLRQNDCGSPSFSENYYQSESEEIFNSKKRPFSDTNDSHNFPKRIAHGNSISDDRITNSEILSPKLLAYSPSITSISKTQHSSPTILQNRHLNESKQALNNMNPNNSRNHTHSQLSPQFHNHSESETFINPQHRRSISINGDVPQNCMYESFSGPGQLSNSSGIQSRSRYFSNSGAYENEELSYMGINQKREDMRIYTSDLRNLKFKRPLQTPPLEENEPNSEMQYTARSHSSRQDNRHQYIDPNNMNSPSGDFRNFRNLDSRLLHPGDPYLTINRNGINFPLSPDEEWNRNGLLNARSPTMNFRPEETVESFFETPSENNSNDFYPNNIF